ncbi:MAG: M81 family metallopeptidase [Gemmataceae bacterium]|nr:M81 family metallopeptidase [Gemmataceae bacterium]
MRVGVVSLMHESNTFAGGTTPLAAFERDTLVTGEAVRERYAGTHHEVGGFFEQLAEDGIEAVPLFAAWTMPSGTIEWEAADELFWRMYAARQEGGRVDGILAAAHGAAVAGGEPDYDGYWLPLVRQDIGRAVPLIGTLDLHANLSPRMVAVCDGLLAYRTNPHLDQRPTGREAAALMARTLRGEVRPVTAAAFPPLAVNIEAQATAEEPCRGLMAVADDIRRRPKVLAVSVLLGFPYADVPEMGAAVTVTTDGDPDLAKRYAAELAGWWWDRREQFRGNLISVEDAARRAAVEPGPVCLLDMGDNVGGGSPADGTVLAHELLRQGVGPAFVCLHDPGAARAAGAVGVGGVLPGPVGDRGAPLPGPFTVRSLHDGVFEETEARHGGIRRFDQGPTAVVERPGLTVMLTTRRTGPFSLRQVTAFGLDPARFRVLVAKGVHAPVAAYAPACPTLIRVSTPGVTSADLSRFAYHHRRRPLYPFEPETTWTPEAV